MSFHQRTLEPPEGFDPQTLQSELAGEKNARATSCINRSEPGPAKISRAQDITVLLLDERPLTRECLSISINRCDRGIHVLTAATASDAQPLLDGARPPDILLYNASSRVSSGREPPSRLRAMVEMSGTTPLVVVSDREDVDAVRQAFQVGARGYISTSVGLSVALEAIRLVAAGGAFVPASFLHQLMRGQDPAPEEQAAREQTAREPDREEDQPPGNGSANGLTPRQLTVLKCMKQGKPNKIIAHELGMCESTVKVHVRSILKKLGATNRTEAVYRTIHGLD